MAALIKMLGQSQSGLIVVLICWSLFLVALYLNFRLMARRSMPYARVPLFMLNVSLVGDLFSEVVFIDFKSSDWQFWCVS